MIALQATGRRHDWRRYGSWLVCLVRFLGFLRMCGPLFVFTRRLIVHGCCSDLTPEDAVADERVDQHQGKDDHATPEHEHETGWRRGSFVDGDDERNEVRPERQRQRAKCRHEDHGDRVERPTIIVTEDAAREHDCGDRANRREYEEIRPVDPAMKDLEMLSQRVNEDDDKKQQYAN